MAFEPISALYRSTFQDNVALACQQLRSRLRDTCTFHPNLRGREARVLQLVAPRTATRNGVKGGPTPKVQGQLEDVWITPEQLEDGYTEEKEDDLKLVTDLSNPNLMAHAAAFERGVDQMIAEAFFAPRRTGDRGLTIETYANPNVPGGFIAHDYVKTGAPTSSGLTFPKIVRAQSLLGLSEQDLLREKLFMAVTNVQVEDLYTQIQFLSSDFTNRVKTNEAAKIVTEFMGIEFIRLPASMIPAVAGQPQRRRNPLWMKSGLHYGEFSPLETSIERSIEFKNRPVAYGEMWFGVTRSEDVKLVEVRCEEA